MVEYTLERKRVKNINLRVRRDLTVAVSAPARVPRAEIDAFVQSRAEWIDKARQRLRAAQAALPAHTDEEALAYLGQISREIYPLFAPVLPKPPVLQVREMRSRWGVCYPARGCITLNKRLLDYPRAAAEYVVLHEYVHFIHPDHQAGFHRMMARLMPDYRARRQLLAQPAPGAEGQQGPPVY